MDELIHRIPASADGSGLVRRMYAGFSSLPRYAGSGGVSLCLMYVTDGNPGRLALEVGGITTPATPLDWDGSGELVSNTAPTEKVDCRVVWPVAFCVRVLVL